MPIAISVNMFGLARTTDSQPRAKNGQPPHSTTGVASASWRRATTRGSIACGAAMPPIARPRSGRVSSALHTRRRVIAASSGLSPSALTARGSSAMPHTGQEPGSSRTTSGCIGQTYSPAPGAAGTEYCQAGVCYSRTPLVCDDGDPCTVNTCDPSLGCQFQPSAGCMIGGQKFKLGSHSDLRVVLQTAGGYGGGAFPPANGPDDPVLHGASVRIYTTNGDMFDNTYGLPSSNCAYVAALAGNYGYIYKDLNGLLGAIGPA